MQPQGGETGTRSRPGAPVLGVRPGMPARGWGSGPGWRWHGAVGEGPMGRAGSASRGHVAASTRPVKRGGPRCPEAPGASPCASRAHRAGRAVPPAAADGGCQLRSVTFLADPVISISRQVLKSSWKPARRQPRQRLPRGILGLSARPALGCRGGGGWPAQSATCCWSSFLEGISLLLGSSNTHARSLPRRCSRAQSISIHQSQGKPCRKHKKKPYSIAINSTCSQSYL